MLDHRIGSGVEFVVGLILNRVGDKDGLEIRASERGGLHARRLPELFRGHGNRRDAFVFQSDRIVHTARGAGASIGQGFNNALHLCLEDPVQNFRGGRLREGRLLEANDLGSAELFLQ